MIHSLVWKRHRFSSISWSSTIRRMWAGVSPARHDVSEGCFSRSSFGIEFEEFSVLRTEAPARQNKLRSR